MNLPLLLPEHQEISPEAVLFRLEDNQGRPSLYDLEKNFPHAFDKELILERITTRALEMDIEAHNRFEALLTRFEKEGFAREQVVQLSSVLFALVEALRSAVKENDISFKVLIPGVSEDESVIHEDKKAHVLVSNVDEILEKLEPSLKGFEAFFNVCHGLNLILNEIRTLKSKLRSINEHTVCSEQKLSEAEIDLSNAQAAEGVNIQFTQRDRDTCYKAHQNNLKNQRSAVRRIEQREASLKSIIADFVSAYSDELPTEGQFLLD